MTPPRDLPPRHELPDPDSDEPADVGMAQMDADGTLRLYLRTETPDGMVGEAVAVLKPGEARYDATLQHLGGLQPGQSKPIPPFPPPQVDPDLI